MPCFRPCGDQRYAPLCLLLPLLWGPFPLTFLWPQENTSLAPSELNGGFQATPIPVAWHFLASALRLPVDD